MWSMPFNRKNLSIIAFARLELEPLSLALSVPDRPDGTCDTEEALFDLQRRAVVAFIHLSLFSTYLESLSYQPQLYHVFTSTTGFEISIATRQRMITMKTTTMMMMMMMMTMMMTTIHLQYHPP